MVLAGVGIMYCTVRVHSMWIVFDLRIGTMRFQLQNNVHIVYTPITVVEICSLPQGR